MSLDIVREAFAKQVIKDSLIELRLVPDSLKEVDGTVRGSLCLLTYDEQGSVQEIKEQEVEIVSDLSKAGSFPQVLEAAGLVLMKLDAMNRMQIVPSDLFPLRAWGHPDVASAVESIGSSYDEMRTRGAADEYDAMFEGLPPLAPADRDRIIQAWFRNEEPDTALASDLADRPHFIDYIERFFIRWTWGNDDRASWLRDLSPALEVAPRARALRLFALIASDHDGWITLQLEAWPDARAELAARVSAEPETAKGVRALLARLDHERDAVLNNSTAAAIAIIKAGLDD